MAVPTRAEALKLFLSLSPSPRLLRHSTVVAELSSFLAYRAEQARLSVDRRLAVTAALLHDVDKALPADHELRKLGHGAAGAEWLAAAGHPELSRAVAAHPVMRLNDPAAADWVANGPIEEHIVTYADKRATQRVVSLDQRFERWQRKHPEYSARLASARTVAIELETRLCAQLAITPGQVERLRWVDEALSRATEAGTIDSPEADGGAAHGLLGMSAGPEAPASG